MKSDRQRRIEAQERALLFLRDENRKLYNDRVKHYESAKKKYNEIMMKICHEYATIGTDYSENTYGWNIRDMVAEADYCLSCYYEGGHADNEMKREDPKRWRAEVGYLTRFINHWAKHCVNIRCLEDHCSRFDNADKREGWREIPEEYM